MPPWFDRGVTGRQVPRGWIASRQEIWMLFLPPTPSQVSTQPGPKARRTLPSSAALPGPALKSVNAVCFLCRHSNHGEISPHGSFCVSRLAWPRRAPSSAFQFYQTPHPPLLRNAGRCSPDKPVFCLFLCN